jgi:NAD-dependent DNA ligase
VYGEKAGSKLDKAKKLNVETLTESDFSKLISK